MNQTAIAGAVQDSYSANLNIDGAHISVVATSMPVLSDLIARLKGGKPVEAPGKSAAAGAAPAKASAAPAPVAATPATSGEAGNATAAAPTPAASPSAPPAAAPASAQPQTDASTQAQAVSYDDVKARVNKLYAIKPQHAVDALAKFGVKKGPELQPQQWPEFVEYADAQIKTMGA